MNKSISEGAGGRLDGFGCSATCEATGQGSV